MGPGSPERAGDARRASESDKGRPWVEPHGWWMADNAATGSGLGHQACLRARWLDRVGLAAPTARSPEAGDARNGPPAWSRTAPGGRLGSHPDGSRGWSRPSEAPKAEARERGGSWGTRDNSSVAEIGERHLPRRVGGTPVPPEPLGVAGSGGPQPRHRRASGGCEAGVLTAAAERFRSSVRSPSPKGEVEPIEGALDPSGGTSLAGVLPGWSWFRGVRGGAPIGASWREAAGAGRPAVAPRDDMGCQSLWRLGVGSPSRKARGVGGMSRARGRASRPQVKLSRPKAATSGTRQGARTTCRFREADGGR